MLTAMQPSTNTGGQREVTNAVVQVWQEASCRTLAREDAAAVHDILFRLMHMDPAQRCSAAQLLRHPWLRQTAECMVSIVLPASPRTGNLDIKGRQASQPSRGRPSCALTCL